MWVSLYLILQLTCTIVFVLKRPVNYQALVFVNVLLLIIVVPSLYIHMRYLAYSKGKRVMINDTFIGIFDKTTNSLTKIILDQTSKIIYVTSSNWLAPWSSYNYTKIIAGQNDALLITSYIMDADVLLAALQERGLKSKMSLELKNFPII